MPIKARDKIKEINKNSIRGMRVKDSVNKLEELSNEQGSGMKKTQPNKLDKNIINFFENLSQNTNLPSVNQITPTSGRLQNEVSNERPNRPHSPVENVSENKQQGQRVTEPTPSQCSDPSSSLFDQSHQKHQTKPAHETKRSIKHVGDSQKNHLATQSISFYKFVNQRYASLRSKNQSQGVSDESVATQASTQMPR